MIKLTDLVKKILTKHVDPNTRAPELILLGHCSNEAASEHIIRYIFASKFAHGIVLDIASSTCYGSSILKRNDAVKMVVSVDIDESVLHYGRMVYGANSVHADAIHPPFREQSFDTVVSLETLEHLKFQELFLTNIRNILKRGGRLILSTPNKMCTSPLIPKPPNPYHIKEFYLGPLLTLLQMYGFKVNHIYGGKRVSILGFLRRILGTLLKFLLSKFFLKPYLVDELYRSILHLIPIASNRREAILVDPDPNLFTHEELRVTSNIILYEYFIIVAHLMDG
jgi:SAM-dependent methyltransferase